MSEKTELAPGYISVKVNFQYPLGKFPVSSSEEDPYSCTLLGLVGQVDARICVLYFLVGFQIKRVGDGAVELDLRLASIGFDKNDVPFPLGKVVYSLIFPSLGEIVVPDILPVERGWLLEGFDQPALAYSFENCLFIFLPVSWGEIDFALCSDLDINFFWAYCFASLKLLRRTLYSLTISSSG